VSASGTGGDAGRVDVEPAARELQRRGLALPALVLLEAHRPLRPLLALGATFLLPITRPTFGAWAVTLERLLADDGEYERLVTQLRRRAGG
jgi:hypothetical protein